MQEEKVVGDGHRPCNILNFQDFVLEEDKKVKKETKKSKKLIKNRKEFIEDKGDDVFDPNECPERYVKLREQFINEDYKRVLAGKQAPHTIHFSRLTTLQKRVVYLCLNPKNIFVFTVFLYGYFLDFSYFFVIFVLDEI